MRIQNRAGRRTMSRRSRRLDEAQDAVNNQDQKSMAKQMTFGSLFAGIGGFDLGFERAGLRVAWQVEINKYCQRVLKKHWPDCGRWDDIRTFPPPPVTDWRVDIICGGFPCQDISVAGNRRGIHGRHSGLYAEMLRVIRSLRPSYVVIENVAAIRSCGLTVVLHDLAVSGYDAEWEVLPACAFGAPHTRERMFIVAYPNGYRLQGMFRRMEKEQRREAIVFTGGDPPERRVWQQLPSSIFCRSADGIPNRVDRTRAIGNSVVPQAAEWIARRIIYAHTATNA